MYDVTLWEKTKQTQNMKIRYVCDRDISENNGIPVAYLGNIHASDLFLACYIHAQYTVCNIFT